MFENEFRKSNPHTVATVRVFSATTLGYKKPNDLRSLSRNSFFKKFYGRSSFRKNVSHPTENVIKFQRIVGFFGNYSYIMYNVYMFCIKHIYKKPLDSIITHQKSKKIKLKYINRFWELPPAQKTLFLVLPQLMVPVRGRTTYAPTNGAVEAASAINRNRTLFFPGTHLDRWEKVDPKYEALNHNYLICQLCCRNELQSDNPPSICSHDITAARTINFRGRAPSWVRTHLKSAVPRTVGNSYKLR